MKKTLYKISTLGNLPILYLLLVIAGTIILLRGIIAYKTGAIIPQTNKSGWMTATHAISIGSFLIFIGAAFMAVYLYKTKRNNINIMYFYDIGKHQVIVKNKNKSWGIVNSVDLVLNDGRILTFYCTTSKVAVMLLNDFVIDQEAELEIRAKNGQDCELTSKNAYAHGIVLLKREEA